LIDIAQELLDRIEEALGGPPVQQCEFEDIATYSNAPPQTDDQMANCLRDLMCQKSEDRQMMQKTKGMLIASRGPKKTEVITWDGKQWKTSKTTRHDVSNGTTVELSRDSTLTAKDGKTKIPFKKGTKMILLNRNTTCEELQIAFYHEMVHATLQDKIDPNKTNERERDAYKKTEHWAILRGIKTPQNPKFRTAHPGHGNIDRPDTVDEDEINDFVDHHYGKEDQKQNTNQGGSHQAAAPHIISHGVENGVMLVLLNDDTKRPAQPGDTYERDVPGQNLAMKAIGSDSLVCP
jgi:hypothetical protein